MQSIVKTIKNGFRMLIGKANDLRATCSAYKNAHLVVFGVFVLTMFLQMILFHLIAFSEVASRYCTVYTLIIRLSFSLFVGSFLFLTKRKCWILVVSFFIGIWSMAELIYYRAYNVFIEEYSITMAGNMNGVWDSIWIFNHLEDWLLLFPTLALLVVFWLFGNAARNKASFVVVLLISVALNCLSTQFIHRMVGCGYKVCNHSSISIMNPFAKNKDATYLGFTTEEHITYTSVFHSFIFQLKDLICLAFNDDVYQMPQEDEKEVNRFLNLNKFDNQPNTPLVIVLLESVEAWAITPETTPNLCKFIDETPSILYANKVSAQVRHGVSGDGQMIVNTGLLPITDGAASFRFPHNVYPALSHLYKKTGLIAASSLSYWNQKFMSQSYGIKQNYVVKAVDDKHIVEKYLEVKSRHDFLIVLTMSTHAPFNYCTQNVYQKTEGMPDEIYNYLNSVKYMDMQLAMLLKDIKENPITNSSTVVITADHSGLSRDLRKQFEAFSKEHNQGFSNISGHIPLLIYSPLIENKTIINDPIYQMDIYPTLLHLLGCDKYYWKGVGVNLLEQDAWVNRPISPNEAQVLSDKIIRSNYFEKIK